MKRKPARKRRSLVIAYIHPGQASAYFLDSMLMTVLADTHPQGERKIEGVLREWSSANISAARNYLTGEFLDNHTADWLLWVDADMQWTPEAVDQLMAAADPVERPIVGGLCFGMTDGRLFPTIYLFGDDDEGVRRTVRVGYYPENTVMRVAATGAAFLLIHRSALEKIRAANFNDTFPFFQEQSYAGQPAGEDVVFCLRALQCEIPVYVHTGVPIGHHKSQLLTEELFLSQAKPPDPAPVLQPAAGSGSIQEG